jgi:hypothetical protein
MPDEEIIQTVELCANLMVEMGHFPSWPLMEIRKP